MMKEKVIAVLLSMGMVVSVSGCTVDQAAQSAFDMINSISTSDGEEVMSVKNGHLTSYSSTVTVGKALDDFLSNPKWSYFKADTGERVVQCVGGCTYNNEDVEAKVQFLLNDDESFEVHALALNDISQNQLVLYAFMSKVFEGYGSPQTSSDNAVQATEASTNNTYSSNNINNEYEPDDMGPAERLLAADAYELDCMEVTVDELRELSSNDVRIVLNALYAYHGYTFNNQTYADYFGTMSWYYPMGKSMEACEREFNATERKNKDTIVAYEKSEGLR